MISSANIVAVLLVTAAISELALGCSPTVSYLKCQAKSGGSVSCLRSTSGKCTPSTLWQATTDTTKYSTLKQCKSTLVQCNPAEDCNSLGTCNAGTGTCVCNEDITSGANCEPDLGYCGVNEHCTDGGDNTTSCNTGVNKCVCTACNATNYDYFHLPGGANFDTAMDLCGNNMINPTDLLNVTLAETEELDNFYWLPVMYDGDGWKWVPGNETFEDSWITGDAGDPCNADDCCLVGYFDEGIEILRLACNATVVPGETAMPVDYVACDRLSPL